MIRIGHLSAKWALDECAHIAHQLAWMSSPAGGSGALRSAEMGKPPVGSSDSHYISVEQRRNSVCETNIQSSNKGRDDEDPCSALS
jgi:hypothetical protein